MYKKEVILMFRLLFLISLIALVMPFCAELDLKPVGPDQGETVEYTYNQQVGCAVHTVSFHFKQLLL
jgi:hypothetical protein